MTTLNGTNQADYLFSTPLTDEVRGFGGKDILRGHLGDDFLYGHDGADRLFGNSGNDFLYVGTGDDALDRGDCLDTLFGGLGAWMPKMAGARIECARRAGLEATGVLWPDV